MLPTIFVVSSDGIDMFNRSHPKLAIGNSKIPYSKIESQ